MIRNWLPASLSLLFVFLLPARHGSAQTPPDPFQVHIQAAQTALHAGLPLVAAREYRIALRLHPADADAHYALAGVLEEAGRADEAQAEYRQTLRLRPDDAPAHNALAGLLEDRGETAAALDQYRQAVALLPADPRLHFNLGAALADAGLPADAAAQYRDALRLNPGFSEAAQALRALGPTPGHTFPGSPVARPPLLPKGEGRRKGQDRSAGAYLHPLLSEGEGRRVRRGEVPPGEVAHALALARAGRLLEAVAAFRAVLARDPRNAAARLQLGIALYADGQTGPARRAWEQVRAAGDPQAAAQARRLLAQYP